MPCRRDEAVTTASNSQTDKPKFVESIETQLFGHVADRQLASSQQLSPQQRKPALVRNNLDGYLLAEPNGGNKRMFRELPLIHQPELLPFRPGIRDLVDG